MRSRLSPDELGIFYRQLAVMLRSGVALPEAVTALSAEKELPRIKKRVGRIKKDMAAGCSFTECLTGQRDLFNPALAKILALDHNAQTADILIRFAEIEERSSEIGNTPKTLLKSLLFYPSIVLCIVITITFLMLIFVIPVFEEMFASMGGGLPAPTQLVFDISMMITGNSLNPILLLIIIIALLISAKFFFYWAAGKIPTFRALLEKIAVAEFAEYFSLMIAAGLPFKESLAGSADSVKNPCFAARLKKKYRQGSGYP
ncbi:Type II secretion system (T2SS), protein F [Candidatus Electrothrix marina]|uniref:Type II secretion system (T2SS), protein F n=1 Tax=Candidatus Electrothrix marina TaxID=1859130 RepID=A0A444JBC9_9BACT|nr:Type II secretion system (T2SS), protein F [Candidatus Electrothrix marina]